MKYLYASLMACFSLVLITSATAETGKDVWYDARGEVYRVTRAQKEKQPFVPEWRKRELAREAARANRSHHRPVSRYYTTYGYPYYVHPHFVPFGYSRHLNGHHNIRHRPFHFRGNYRGNGWSVRVRY